jgi:hypothetical protein
LKAPDPEELAVRRLSNSPYLAAVADSVLENLDRETLTELLAYYLYQRSKGRGDLRDLAAHAVSKRPWKWLDIATNATAALIAGMLSDGEFRSVVLSSVKLWIRGSPRPDAAEEGL